MTEFLVALGKNHKEWVQIAPQQGGEEKKTAGVANATPARSRGLVG